MIELPGPGWPPGPVDPGGSGHGSRRGFGWAAVVLVLLVVLVVALVNAHRTSGNQPAAQNTPGPLNSLSLQPSAPGSGGPNGGSPNGQSQNGGGSPVPAVACPQIRDEISHLAYQCIDNYLVQDSADIYLGLRIALNHQVEPGWVISEGSGDADSVAPPPNNTVVRYQTSPGATPADVEKQVQLRTALALQNAYGTGPSARTRSAGTRNFAGVQGYELVTEVTIDQAYRQAQGLQVRTERLWVVGLPTSAGVSIFMMSIPDERADLWPRAEATVGTVHVI